MILTDGVGNILWQTALGGGGDDILRGIISTTDGGFVAVGDITSMGAGGHDLWAVKLSSSGDLLWQKAYGGGADDFGEGILPASGGFLVYGYSYSASADRGQDSDACALRLDAQGNLLWARTYGTSGMDQAYAGIATASGFLFAGGTNGAGAAQQDILLFEVDGEGSLLWQESLGGAASDQAFALSAASDGGFVVGGSSRSFGTGSYDAWLVKADRTRALQWQWNYGGDGDEKIYGLLQTSDLGFLAVGESQSYGSGAADLWALKVKQDGSLSPCGLGSPTTAAPSAISLAEGIPDFQTNTGGSQPSISQARLGQSEAVPVTQCECTRSAAIPQLSSPANAAEGVSASVDLVWGPAANADSYSVQMGTSLASLASVGTTTATRLTVTGLKSGTVYFWNVISVGPCSQSPAAPWWFQTAGASPLGTYTYIVPVVARVGGAQDSHWITDLSVLNPSGQAVACTLTFTPSGWDGVHAPLSLTTVIDAKAMDARSDLLGNTFFVDNVSGWLRVETSGPTEVTGRIYHRGAGGTYGQSVFGMEEGDAAHILTSGHSGHLLHLAGSARYRTNLGLVEPTGLGGIATISVFGASGTLLGTMTQPVPPGGHIQINNLFDTLGIAEPVDAARAVVAVGGAGRIVAYASVVDNVTNDAILLPAEDASTAASPLFIPVVTHVQGALDTLWRSDVRLFNPASVSQNVTLAYRWDGGTLSIERTLHAMELGDLPDVVASLFPGAGDSSGSLELTSASGIMATSRTYNLAENGTYGQFIPAEAGSEGLSAGDTAYLPHLSGTASFRSNVGFTEMAGAPLTVQGSLFDVFGRLLGQGTWTVPAWGHLQVNNIFTALSAPGEAYFAYLQLDGLDGAGTLAAYASVVDNLTGDAIYIPARK